MGKKISASQAAKRVGKSVPTITRAIKSGKLSAEPNPDGGWLIDPSELERVWRVTPVKGNALPNALQTETPNEMAVLQVKLEAKDEKITSLEQQLRKAEEDRDDWKDQAKTLLIANQNQPAPSQKVGWFDRLLGRA